MAQSSTEFLTPSIRRVGDRLACLCGSCKNTVATCQMLGCHYSAPAREKIAKLQAAGLSDDAIVDDFVKKEGIKALSVPPTEGFSLVGWLMPFIALGMGLGMIVFFIKRFRKPSVDTVPVDVAVLDRYHEQIEKDMAKLE